MNKLIFLFLLVSFNSFGQLGDIYKSNGHPKAKGLNFQLRPPLGFQELETDYPNTVKQWKKQNGEFFVTITAKVTYLPDELKGFPKDELKQYLKYEGGVKDFTSSPNMTNAKYYEINSYPAVFFETSEDRQRLDVKATIYMYQIIAFVEDYFFTLSLISSNKSLVLGSSEYFDLVANSIVFTDQYK